MQDSDAVYRAPTFTPAVRAPHDPRAIAGLSLGVAGVVLGLAALWIAVTSGLFSRPSVATLGPVFPAALCALGASSMALRLWRGRRRIMASAVFALALLALSGSGLAAWAYATTEEPPPWPSISWSFGHC